MVRYKNVVMKYYLVLALFAIGISSCKKETDKGNELNGTYKGTFKRYNVQGAQEAQVELVFNYPNWTGTSSIQKYPALSNGTFSYKDYELKFKNGSAWTADFDWTFILDGNYLDHPSGDSLTITRSYGNGAVDVYKLKRQ